MKELIDHMLFLAKTDADQMAVSFSPLDVNDTLWSCLLPFVHNQGEAIPAEDLLHIFERFYRVDASRSRSAGGYGLGLAIAKTIADRHKASLRVNSSAPEGTTFILRLPLKDN